MRMYHPASPAATRHDLHRSPSAGDRRRSPSPRTCPADRPAGLRLHRHRRRARRRSRSTTTAAAPTTCRRNFRHDHFQDLLRDQTYTFTELVPAGWVAQRHGQLLEHDFRADDREQRERRPEHEQHVNCTFTNPADEHAAASRSSRTCLGRDRRAELPLRDDGRPVAVELRPRRRRRRHAVEHSISYTNIPASRTYTFTEDAIPGWLLDGIVACSGIGGDPDRRRRERALTNGENVICTFVNLKNTADVTIIKDVAGGTDAQDFTLHHDRRPRAVELRPRRRRQQRRPAVEHAPTPTSPPAPTPSPRVRSRDGRSPASRARASRRPRSPVA